MGTESQFLRKRDDGEMEPKAVSFAACELRSGIPVVLNPRDSYAPARPADRSRPAANLLRPRAGGWRLRPPNSAATPGRFKSSTTAAAAGKTILSTSTSTGPPAADSSSPQCGCGLVAGFWLTGGAVVLRCSGSTPCAAAIGNRANEPHQPENNGLHQHHHKERQHSDRDRQGPNPSPIRIRKDERNARRAGQDCQQPAQRELRNEHTPDCGKAGWLFKQFARPSGRG